MGWHYSCFAISQVKLLYTKSRKKVFNLPLFPLNSNCLLAGRAFFCPSGWRNELVAKATGLRWNRINYSETFTDDDFRANSCWGQRRIMGRKKLSDSLIDPDHGIPIIALHLLSPQIDPILKFLLGDCCCHLPLIFGGCSHIRCSLHRNGSKSKKSVPVSPPVSCFCGCAMIAMSS